jgi:RNA-binding protein PNO1
VRYRDANSLIRFLEDDGLLIDNNATQSEAAIAAPVEPPGDLVMQIDEEGRPRFPPAKAVDGPRPSETRKVSIPPHRMTPLKRAWPQIYPPVGTLARLEDG